MSTGFVGSTPDDRYEYLCGKCGLDFSCGCGNEPLYCCFCGDGKPAGDGKAGVAGLSPLEEFIRSQGF